MFIDQNTRKIVNFIFVASLILSLQACDSNHQIEKILTKEQLEIDQAVKKSYHIWYVKKGAKPDFSNFEDYVTNSATFHSIEKNKISVRTFSEVSNSFVQSFETGDLISFDEREIGAETIIMGDIAHRISYHIYRINSNDKISHRGVNSIQLVRINGVWKTQSVLRQLEGDNYSLPKKYDSFK